VKTAPPWVIPGQQDGRSGESFPYELDVVYDPPEKEKALQYGSGRWHIHVGGLLEWAPGPGITPGSAGYFAGDYGPLTSDDLGKVIGFSGSVRVTNILSPLNQASFMRPLTLTIFAYTYDGASPVYRRVGPGVSSSPFYIFPDCAVIVVDTEEEKRKGRELLAKLAREMPSPEVLEREQGDIIRWINCYKPDLRFVETPSIGIIPAAEPFEIEHFFINQGTDIYQSGIKVSEGSGQCQSRIDGLVQTFTAKPQTTYRILETGTMPWDDIEKVYDIGAFSFWAPFLRLERINIDGKDATLLPLWVQTDARKLPFEIKAGFPLAALGDIDAPDIAKPGDRIRVNFPVRNDGFRGDVGVRVSLPGFDREIMERIDSGATITPSYSGEMPPAEVVRISVTPIHLGRNREVVAGESRSVEIKPTNCLLHWENFITIRGGYREFNPVAGFVAGKNLRIRGLESSIGTGGPPFFPYGGYILSGNLGPEDIATIEYDELYYLRVETDKNIATAMLGSLIDRATTLYEYSVIPTPAMVLRIPRVFGTMLTGAVPTLEVLG